MVGSSDLYSDKYWNTPVLMVATFFYTIAGTIGGGLMVLPVELSKTGFWAFPIVSIMPLLAEFCGAIIFIQILQKVRIYLVKEGVDGENIGKTGSHEYKPIPIKEEDVEMTKIEVSSDKEHDHTDKHLLVDSSNEPSQDSLTEDLIPKKVITKEKSFSDTSSLISTTFFSSGIDLHTIGRLYFRWWYTILIDLLLFLGVFPFSYVNGVAQTIAVIGLSDESSVMKLTKVLSPIISMLGFIFIFFLGSVVEWLVCGLSFVHAALILLVVCLGLAIVTPFNSAMNLAYFSRIYFSETMMIAGSVFFIPQIFSKLRPGKWNVIYFTISVILGLIVTQLICFVWAFSVWGVVPQDSSSGSDINLVKSQESGDLSNVPFKLMLKRDYPDMLWLGVLVEVFTLMSFVVSFLVYTSILKSVMDGYIKEIATWFINKATTGTDTRRNDIMVPDTNHNQQQSTEKQQQQQQQEEEDQEEDFEVYTFQQEEIEQEEEQRTATGHENRRRFRWKVKLMIFSFQFFIYMMMAIFVSFLCYALYAAQYYVTEFLGLIDVLVYLCFVVGLGVVDVIINPFKDIKIWWEIPRWFFVLMCCCQGIYYICFSIWYFVYNSIRFGSFARTGKEISF